MRRAMMDVSRRKILMLDSQKIGDPCLSTLCRIEEIDQIVSERDISSLFPKYAHKFL